MMLGSPKDCPVLRKAGEELWASIIINLFGCILIAQRACRSYESRIPRWGFFRGTTLMSIANSVSLIVTKRSCRIFPASANSARQVRIPAASSEFLISSIKTRSCSAPRPRTVVVAAAVTKVSLSAPRTCSASANLSLICGPQRFLPVSMADKLGTAIPVFRFTSSSVKPRC